MNGINALNITNSSTGTAGFSGNITGLTTVVAATATPGSHIVLGAAGLGLNTALTDITLNSNFGAGAGFTAWMTAAALGGTTDAATVHLPGVTATAHLNVTTGGNGYESLTVDSGGIGSPNVLHLDTNATSTATIIATGAQNLTIDGTALNIANLHTFTGTAATGSLDVFFNGAGHVAATGGSADDTFNFASVAGAGTFSGSSVDGMGGTNNTLVIQADHGAILVATDGPNITNIATVVNDTDAGGATGALSADLTGLNPATIFDLNGAYNTQAISVTDITDAQTVEFSGSGGILTLAHTTPLELDAQINLQISGGATLTELIVGPNLASLNVHSTDGGGTITNVSNVHDSVNLEGGSFLTFGSAANPYTFVDPTSPIGGTIDAHTETGGVDVWLNAGPTATGNVAQTFIGGPGGGTVNLLNHGGAVVSFGIVGPDTIAFQTANVNSAFTTVDPTHQYNEVTGFTNANNSVDIHVPGLFTGAGGVLTNTNSATAVAAGAATNTFDFVTDTIGANATIAPFNYIKIDTATPAAAGLTVQQVFSEAMGLNGSIVVSGAHAHTLSFYNSTTSEMAVVSAQSNVFGIINDTSHVNVIGLVHMSAADYAAFSGPHYIA